MKYLIIIITILIALPNALAQSNISWDQEEVILQNSKIKRIIKLPNTEDGITTSHYAPVQGDFDYWSQPHQEFSFLMDDRQYHGNQKWQIEEIEKIRDEYQGTGVAITIVEPEQRFSVTIRYLIYPDLPLIRKKLSFKNLTNQELKLEAIDIERFSMANYVPITYSWIVHDYGRRRHLGPYKGNMFDVITTIHNMDSRQGIVLGNESPGVLKRTTAFWDSPEITTGLSYPDDRFPFRKWLAPDESWTTPPVFSIVYNDYADPDQVLNNEIATYTRKHLGTRLSTLRQKPTFVYNTWEPFNKDINESLIRELAKAAAEAGMKEFIIDDGWTSSYGDWIVDKKKFPNGLKPVFDYIKSLGMKPGLWISVGSASVESKVFQEHPEYFVRDRNGDFTSLHAEGITDKMTACFATGWYDYIKNILLEMVNDHGLEYLKLDFAVVTSPYMLDHQKSGCYAEDHALHKDRAESFMVLYDRVWQLFDELHQANQEVFIDCTFETMGGMQLIDYAMLKHAEGNWLSNFNAPAPKGSLRVRNMAWWRSPAIPATALVVGNPKMSDEKWKLNIQSAAGALPILLGDPRALSSQDKETFKAYADWLQKMHDRYDIMSFRQDLPGFGEPAEGSWDGYQRINSESKSGGILGIFRQGATEKQRLITIQQLDEQSEYEILEGLSGKKLHQGSGKELLNEGFTIQLPDNYDGILLEVRQLK